MRQPLSIGVLIIPALSAAAAAALVVLALRSEPAGPKRPPEAAAAADGNPVAIGKPARLDAATPVPAPRPGRSPRR